MTDQKRDIWWYGAESTCQILDTGEIREYLNIAPEFGPKHVMSPDCWCHPHISDDSVITHNVMH